MKILLLLSRIPYPLDKGDKLRAYHQIKELIAAKHEVCIACIHYGKINPEHIAHLQAIGGNWHFIYLSPWRALFRLLMNVFSSLPFQVSLFHSHNAQSKIDNIVSHFHPDHIMAQLVRTSEYLKKHVQYNKSIDYMDALGYGLEKRALLSPFWKRWFFKEEADRMQRYENTIWHHFDRHFIISQKDARQIKIPKNQDISILPNGIDTIYFSRQSQTLGHDLLFTGNMAYPPNVDAALFLIHEIMPLVWKARPELRLVIAGTNPDASLIRAQSERIKITGWVSDMRHYYEHAALFIAPMRMGTGMQNKILEAMSMGVPVITTHLASEAFDLSVHTALLKSTDAQDFAMNIIENYRPGDVPNEELRKLVVKNYNWKTSIQHFISTIHEN